MNKKLLVGIFVAVVLVLFFVYPLVSRFVFYRPGPVTAPIGVCPAGISTMMQNGYTSMHSRMGMMPYQFDDGQIWLDGRYYSYMGDWNMGQMYQMMWYGYRHGYNFRFGMPMMGNGMMRGGWYYPLYVLCGYENSFFDSLGR